MGTFHLGTAQSFVELAIPFSGHHQFPYPARLTPTEPEGAIAACRWQRPFVSGTAVQPPTTTTDPRPKEG